MFSLAGKSCVVTGASRGLGRAIALAYAAQGADVVLTARNRVDLESLRAEIEALGRRARVHVGDVTDVANLRAVADAAVSAFGKLDVWVNNAGGDTSIAGGWAEWLDVTEDGWERMLRLNLKAQVFGAQAAARVMRDGAGGGAIIFLSSIDSLYAAPGGEGIYGACKAAINNIVQTMAVELGQYQIRVNAIAPAVVETPLTAPWLATDADRRARSAFYPLRRVGQPPDVAGAAVYFASDEAAVGLRGRAARVRRRRRDERSVSLPDARQQGHRMTSAAARFRHGYAWEARRDRAPRRSPRTGCFARPGDLHVYDSARAMRLMRTPTAKAAGPDPRAPIPLWSSPSRARRRCPHRRRGVKL